MHTFMYLQYQHNFYLEKVSCLEAIPLKGRGGGRVCFTKSLWDSASTIQERAVEQYSTSDSSFLNLRLWSRISDICFRTLSTFVEVRLSRSVSLSRCFFPCVESRFSFSIDSHVFNKLASLPFRSNTMEKTHLRVKGIVPPTNENPVIIYLP